MQKDLSLLEYWLILKRHSRGAATVFLIFFAAVLVLTLTASPVYKATARIYIETGGSRFVPQEQPAPRDQEKRDYFDTQVSILKSRAVARAVASRLGEDLARGGSDETIARLMKGLSVQPVRNTNLVDVSFESDNPELAARVANETARAYMEQNLEMKVAPAREYMGWLSRELVKMRARMNKSSAGLEDFKEQRGIVAGGERHSNIPLMSMTDLNTRVLEAQAARQAAEIRWRRAQELSREPGGLMSLPEVMGSEVVRALKVRQGELERQIAEQSNRFGEKYPQMGRLHSEMDKLDEQLGREAEFIAGSLKNGYDEALRSENSLRSALVRAKSGAIGYERRAAGYELKRQDLEGERAIYNLVFKKFQESGIMGGINVNNAYLLEKAEPPKKPSRPKRLLNIAVGLVFGIFAAAGYAFVSEHVSDAFNSADELEAHLGLPVLGIVPTGGVPGRAAVAADPMSPAAESFRTVRSGLMLSGKGQGPRVVQVCSALRSEGKSTVSANLACVLAETGDRVVLIDGDMRHPSLHGFFGLRNSTGLSSVLTGKALLTDAVKGTPVPRLDLIPSGPPCPATGKLLGGEGMRETVALLKERYDRVVIDCPPYLGIADASLLTPLSDGVLLVVRSGKTARKAVGRLKKSVENFRAEILGVLLNGMDRGSADYYYHCGYAEGGGPGRKKSPVRPARAG